MVKPAIRTSARLRKESGRSSNAMSGLMQYNNVQARELSFFPCEHSAFTRNSPSLYVQLDRLRISLKAYLRVKHLSIPAPVLSKSDQRKPSFGRRIGRKPNGNLLDVDCEQCRRLPMAIDMLTEPMPQEIGTAELPIEAGLAKPIRRPDDIVAIAEAIEVIKEREHMPLPAVHNLDHVDAVYEIARLILELSEPVKLDGRVTSRGVQKWYLQQGVYGLTPSRSARTVWRGRQYLASPWAPKNCVRCMPTGEPAAIWLQA